MCIFSQGFQGAMLIIYFSCVEYCRILHKRIYKFNISILSYFFRHCGGLTLWGPPLSHIFIKFPPLQCDLPLTNGSKGDGGHSCDYIILYNIQQTGVRDSSAGLEKASSCAEDALVAKNCYQSLGPRVSSSQQPAKSCIPRTALRK